ncbi:hypothetical protein TSUD_110690 [Trifolium subterraneum]|uniref:Uncharacterized protein n=1 Tax=Trifolium subterraneum TaxID=3900 RepID=A0A2Z6MSL3_TRISU|nr:hypothetical protein TSUD_110690 [Trifolium subterraneum]
MKLLIISTLMTFLAFAYSVDDESPPPKLSEFKEARSYLDTTQTFDEAYVHSFFEEWMVQYEKNYSTHDEMIKRREIFKKNLLHIQKFNNEGNNSYRLGINQFTDENEDDKSGCVEAIDELLELEERVSFNISDKSSLPIFFDWRDHGAVTPVKKQGKCGSCWAFAATSAIESLVYISGGDLRNLSPQELIDCDIQNHGCEGGRPEKAFIYASRGRRHGITFESLYPYHAKRQPCNVPKNNRIAVFIDGYTVLSTTELSVRIAVTHQPVVAVIYIGDPFKRYAGGIFKGPCGYTGRHAVLIVGYGETHDGVKYWILKNSWGEDWGEEGYIRLLRGDGSTFGLCNILSRPIYPMYAVL